MGRLLNRPDDCPSLISQLGMFYAYEIKIFHSKQLMTRTIKFQLIIWAILSVLIVVGTFIYELSSSVVATPLKLSTNEIAFITVFRILPDTIRLSLSFSREKGQRRVELGEYISTDDGLKNSALNFHNPGEPVKLLIRRGPSEAIYEALPTSSYGNNIERKLVPFVDDGNSNSFMWPPSIDSEIKLKAGIEEIQVAVVSVGKKIEGEQVSLLILPPVTFKSTALNYRWLWWFCWWPIYLLVLAAYGFVLFCKSSHTTHELS